MREEGRGMKSGFTIIELLVASMLLGMLVTVLTMVFNQSSIAWRIGSAMTSNMDDVRDNIAELREESDNAFVYGNDVYRTVGLWDENGNLRDRACDAPNSSVQGETGAHAKFLRNKVRSFLISSQRSPWSNAFSLIPVDGGMSGGSGSMGSNLGGNTPGGGSGKQNFVVNVRSKGPANDEKDWQAIFSYADDPEEWCK